MDKQFLIEGATVQMRVANRQAAKNRERQFEALAAFANLEASQRDWDKLRLMHPEIFSEHWLFTGSEEWAIGLGDDDPSHHYSLRSGEARAILDRRLRYRDCLRSVWSGNDREGRSLRILYGFDLMEQEAMMGMSDPAPGPLLPGKPIVDGLTGEISWEFPLEFQRTLYELMKNRWKAKICPQCGRYFIADKTAQVFCSTGCSGDAKRARSLEYFNREGRARRILRKVKEKRK
jgi:hypothetical protein